MDTVEIRDGRSILKNLNVVVDPNEENLSFANVSKDFKLAVVQGLVPGWSTYRKYGANPLIETGTDPEDISQVGGVIPITTDAWGTAPVVSIGSSSASDAGKSVLVVGNDINNNVVQQVITLVAGRNALTTPLYRVYRAINLGSVAFVGNVFIYTGTGAVPALGAPEVRAYVSNVDNQTQHCLWTVPDGYVFILESSNSGIIKDGTFQTGTQSAVIKFQTRAYNGLWTTKQIVSCGSQGNTDINVKLTAMPLVPARSDVKLMIATVTDTMGVWGDFSGYLVSEDQFSDDVLASIQQP